MEFATEQTWVDFHTVLTTDEQLAWKRTEESMALLGWKCEIVDVEVDYLYDKSNVLARFYK